MTTAEFLAEVSHLIGAGDALEIEQRRVGDMDVFLWPDASEPKRRWWGVASGGRVFALGFTRGTDIERDIADGLAIASARHRARMGGLPS